MSLSLYGFVMITDALLGVVREGVLYSVRVFSSSPVRRSSDMRPPNVGHSRLHAYGTLIGSILETTRLTLRSFRPSGCLLSQKN